MKEVILGCFGSDYFYTMRNNNGWVDYPFGLQGNIRNKKFKSSGSGMVDDIIKQAYLAGKINFLLDEIHLPLNPNVSVTCRELQAIIDNNLIGKTQFWLKGSKIPTEKVLSLINKVKAEQLQFDNIDFSTI